MTYNRGNKGVQTFPKCISPKVNVEAQMELGIAYFGQRYSCSNFSKLFALMWYKTGRIGHPMRLERTLTSLTVKLAKHFTMGGSYRCLMKLATEIVHKLSHNLSTEYSDWCLV